jgi:hypothetical protein
LKESENIIKAIDGLIFEKRNNTLSNHLKTLFKHDEKHFYGNTKNNKFEIWRFTRGAQGMQPIVFGEVVIELNKTTIVLKPKMNSVGILHLILGSIVLSSVLYNGIPFWTGAAGLTSASTILLLLVILFVIIRFIYRYETKAHLNRLMELIDKRTDKKQDYRVVIPAIL